MIGNRVLMHIGKPRWGWFCMTLAVFGTAAASLQAEQPAARTRPNIVLILADDLGINDLSCYGRKDQPTPNLDRLAQQGMRFRGAYCAQPICSPTRAALMTGRAPARLHLTTFLPGRPDAFSQMLLHPVIQQQVSLDATTVAERLKGAGYATGCIGKWHLGGKGFLPTDQGFDVYFPGRANTTPSETEGGKGEYELTAQAEKFLDEHKDGPFFLYLPHNNPHVALAAKPVLVEKHKSAFNPTYAAMIETLDDCVGRVVAKVDALGLANRTLIVFTSDNGGLHVPEGPKTPATHNTPYRAGKGYCYEGGLRIPLIARWNGQIKAGVESDAMVISTDLTPTFVELAGVQTTDPFDGSSLAGLLTAGKPPAARPLFWHFPHYTNQGGRPAGAVREGDWKLVEHYEDLRCELFQLALDPGENEDLSAQEPARVAELRGKLEKWRREMGVQSNTANPQYNDRLGRSLYRDIDTSRLPLESTAAAMAPKLEAWRQGMNDVVRKAAPDGPPSPVAAGPGVILLHARDAKVHGVKLQYEAPPHKDTLGFWVQMDDWAEWECNVPNAGMFELELLTGCGKGSGGAEVEVAVNGQTLTMKVEETGHFQRFVPRVIGILKFDQPGRYPLTLKAKTKPGPAVMDLRRMVLRGVAPKG